MTAPHHRSTGRQSGGCILRHMILDRVLGVVMLLAAVAAVAGLAGSLPAQEIEVPEFHTEKAKASYVLAAPPDHDAARPTPLILDFHGAAAPSRKGANVTHERVWSKFVQQEPVLVLGPNARTRGWDRIRDEGATDTDYALAVLAEVREQYAIADAEVYLAGFSSGSDFLCAGGIQQRGAFAGTLAVCPGPPNVVGLRGGELLRLQDHPVLFVTGEKDYIRKAGAWQAFVALEQVGAPVMYREIRDLDHAFPSTAQYRQCFHQLRILAGREAADDGAIAAAALVRGDYLLASTHARKQGAAGLELLARIEAIGTRMQAAARELSWQQRPGHAYEAWWRLMTQFHRFDAIAAAARAELAAGRSISNRDLLRARRDYFRSGDHLRPEPAPLAPVPAAPAPAVRQPRLAQAQKSPAATGPWSFDEYLSYDALTARLQLLAAENPQRVRLSSMGRSIAGRELWVCTITDDVTKAAHKPAIYVQGGIHGNEISAVMVTLYFAWQMGANPDRRRAIDRLLRDTTIYIAPAVSPDAVQHFVTQPTSSWRPRFNFRPHDADGDGRVDEDGYEDINGDGEISQMYVAAADGVFVLQDGRMVRDSTGAITPRFRHIGREGIDNDGDGRFSEDPVGGVNLNRNFPVGFRPRRDFEGFRGAGPASEPETRAIVDFVTGHPNINLFFDYHNAANCVFYWIGPDGQTRDPADFAHMTAIAGRANKELGFTPRPLDHDGVGLGIAWAYGARGLPACIVELEVGDPKAWGDDAFVEATKCRHPQLGEVWIGNDHRKLAPRNPPPAGIYDQARAHWEFMRDECKELPKLELEQPRIVRAGRGFRVTGMVANTGNMPFESQRAARLGLQSPVTISARGASIAGTTSLPALGIGERRAFDVELSGVGDSVTLVVAHPKGGSFELPVLRRRVATVPIQPRSSYAIEAGYRGVDELQAVVLADDNGPRFALPHRKQALRVAVLLGEFADLRHTVPSAAFDASLFGADYTGTSHTGQPVYGSVRDFYREMSYGAMDVAGRVFDWIELPGSYADYKQASFGSSKFRTALERAVLDAHGEDALDGYDGLIFVWAGNPVRRVSCLWPMRVNLEHRPGMIAFKTGEFYRGQMAPIGVACHEMGHTFGVNDKYGLGAPAQPLGRWCLMGKGTHGAGESMQHRPLHLCAWCKSVIGWVRPTIIDPAKPQKIALRPILSSAAECVRVLLQPDGSEYLLLANRRREGFFTELPSAGLVVLRVGPNDRPSAPQKQVQLLEAHGLGPARRSELQQLEQIAWPQPDRTELTVAGVRLSGIRREADVVYFEVGTVGK